MKIYEIVLSWLFERDSKNPVVLGTVVACTKIDIHRFMPVFAQAGKSSCLIIWFGQINGIRCRLTSGWFGGSVISIKTLTLRSWRPIETKLGGDTWRKQGEEAVNTRRDHWSWMNNGKFQTGAVHSLAADRRDMDRYRMTRRNSWLGNTLLLLLRLMMLMIILFLRQLVEWRREVFWRSDGGCCCFDFVWWCRGKQETPQAPPPSTTPQRTKRNQTQCSRRTRTSRGQTDTSRGQTKSTRRSHSTHGCTSSKRWSTSSTQPCTKAKNTVTSIRQWWYNPNLQQSSTKCPSWEVTN